MRIYLMKLAELIREMEKEKYDLEQEDKFLMVILQVVLVAVWFYQGESLAHTINEWRLGINHLVVIDVMNSVLEPEEK